MISTHEYVAVAPPGFSFRGGGNIFGPLWMGSAGGPGGGSPPTVTKFLKISKFFLRKWIKICNFTHKISVPATKFSRFGTKIKGFGEFFSKFWEILWNFPLEKWNFYNFWTKFGQECFLQECFWYVDKYFNYYKYFTNNHILKL